MLDYDYLARPVNLVPGTLLHAAPLRAERRLGEPRAVPPARVRQALRCRAKVARFTGAHRPLPPDDRARARLRAVADDGTSHRGSRRAAVGTELQAAPGSVRALAISRHRRRAASLIAHTTSRSMRLARAV